MVLRYLKFGAVLVALAVSGCGSGFLHDEELIGPYRLVAVDDMEDMGICRSLEAACSGDGLPDHTIFAAGGDDKYIVLGRHPREWPNPADRSKFEYYYLIRTSSEAKRGLPESNVKGPFNEGQFAAEKRRLNLPGFSRVFDELR